MVWPNKLSLSYTKAALATHQSRRISSDFPSGPRVHFVGPWRVDINGTGHLGVAIPRLTSFENQVECPNCRGRKGPRPQLSMCPNPAPHDARRCFCFIAQMLSKLGSWKRTGTYGACASDCSHPLMSFSGFSWPKLPFGWRVFHSGIRRLQNQMKRPSAPKFDARRKPFWTAQTRDGL